MPAYVVVEVEVLDKERYETYKQMVPPTLAVYEEPIPVFDGWPDAPCGYLQFTSTYDVGERRARSSGWTREWRAVISKCSLILWLLRAPSLRWSSGWASKFRKERLERIATRRRARSAMFEGFPQRASQPRRVRAA